MAGFLIDLQERPVSPGYGCYGNRKHSAGCYGNGVREHAGSSSEGVYGQSGRVTGELPTIGLYNNAEG